MSDPTPTDRPAMPGISCLRCGYEGIHLNVGGGNLLGDDGCVRHLADRLNALTADLDQRVWALESRVERLGGNLPVIEPTESLKPVEQPAAVTVATRAAYTEQEMREIEARAIKCPACPHPDHGPVCCSDRLCCCLVGRGVFATEAPAHPPVTDLMATLKESLAKKAAPATEAPAVPSYGPGRCEICGWTLAASVEGGCTAGNCSYRPPNHSPEHRRIRERRAALGADKLATEAPAPSEPIGDLRFELQEARDNIERMRVVWEKQRDELEAMTKDRDHWQDERVRVGNKLDLHMVECNKMADEKWRIRFGFDKPPAPSDVSDYPDGKRRYLDGEVVQEEPPLLATEPMRNIRRAAAFFDRCGLPEWWHGPVDRASAYHALSDLLDEAEARGRASPAPLLLALADEWGKWTQRPIHTWEVMAAIRVCAQELRQAVAQATGQVSAKVAPSPAVPSLAPLHALADRFDSTNRTETARELREALAKLPVSGAVEQWRNNLTPDERARVVNMVRAAGGQPLFGARLVAADVLDEMGRT